MILHIYHCNLAIISDYKVSQGRNRPSGTGRFPEAAGEADVQFTPLTNTFGDRDLGELLRMFQSIDLADLSASPVRMNWKYIEDRLGCERSEIYGLLQKADRLGLLRSLTIEYDHEKWMQSSSEKGCLVVMACVERRDLARELSECASAVCEAVNAVKRDVAPKQVMRQVFVIPNGHLAPRAKPLPWKRALEILQAVPPALKAQGYEATLGSYGYPKLIQLAINAHKLGYVGRVV